MILPENEIIFCIKQDRFKKKSLCQNEIKS